MKHLLFFTAIIFSVSVFSQTETVFYPLLVNAKDKSGNHNNGRLAGKAIIDDALITPYNSVSHLNVPIAVINGLLHYDIELEVSFDSLHVSGLLARNSVIDGGYECGDGHIDLFYNEVGHPAKSWVLLLEGQEYVFHDHTLLAQEWDHLKIEKRFDSVKMYRNSRLLGAYADKSDSINILALELGQAAACDGDITPMCMDGRLKNFRIISYDKAHDSLTTAVQQVSVKSTTSVLNIYPNPSNGIIAVSLDRMIANINQTVVIKVYNNFGQLVKEISSPVNKNPVTLDLSNVPAGIYFIRTETGNSASTGKVVIK